MKPSILQCPNFRRSLVDIINNVNKKFPKKYSKVSNELEFKD